MSGQSDVMEPIRQLTRKNVTWNWSNTQERALEKMNILVNEAPVLCFYDHAKEITVQCDASQTGLGAALLQEGPPLAFASRALIYTTKIYGVVCPPNISETVAVRTVKLANRPRIASTTIKFISKPIIMSIL